MTTKVQKLQRPLRTSMLYACCMFDNTLQCVCTLSKNKMYKYSCAMLYAVESDKPSTQTPASSQPK